MPHLGSARRPQSGEDGRCTEPVEQERQDGGSKEEADRTPPPLAGHRLLLPASAMFGAALLTFADTFARVLAAPAEIPVGILTASIGAPFFLYVLLRQRALVGS